MPDLRPVSRAAVITSFTVGIAVWLAYGVFFVVHWVMLDFFDWQPAYIGKDWFTIAFIAVWLVTSGVGLAAAWRGRRTPGKVRRLLYLGLALNCGLFAWITYNTVYWLRMRFGWFM